MYKSAFMDFRNIDSFAYKDYMYFSEIECKKGHSLIHVLSFKGASGRFSFHFREIFISFQGDFRKMYRIKKNIIQTREI